MKVLTWMQSLTGLGNGGWRFHYQGLGALLASRGNEIHEDEMFRALYYAVLPHEVSRLFPIVCEVQIYHSAEAVPSLFFDC
jgi:hypothetical protein